MKPHKWAKEIKAWADGAEIESRFKDKVTGWSEWDCMREILAFSEDDWWEYRIKPQPKEPVAWMDINGHVVTNEYKEKGNQFSVQDEPFSTYTIPLYKE